MRVRSDDLQQHLKRGLAPLYVVFGDEELLALEAADAVRAAARAAGYAEREVLTVEGGFNWSLLGAQASTLSLFGSQRILEVRIPSGKPGTAGAAALEAFARDLPPDTVTLVTLPKLDKTAQNSKWFKALEAAGTLVPVFPVERRQLPAWIGQRLARQQQQADQATLEFMADLVEGNLLAAHQEIQKLALLYPAGRLTTEQIREAVLPVARFDVFALSDAMLANEPARFVRILDNLRQEGVEPVLILWALAREIRTLARLKGLLGGGMNEAQAFREARVWDNRQALFRRALARVNGGALRAALAGAAQLDALIKGLRAGDVWDEMTRLGMMLCGGAAVQPLE